MYEVRKVEGYIETYWVVFHPTNGTNEIYLNMVPAFNRRNYLNNGGV